MTRPASYDSVLGPEGRGQRPNVTNPMVTIVKNHAASLGLKLNADEAREIIDRRASSVHSACDWLSAIAAAQRRREHPTRVGDR